MTCAKTAVLLAALIFFSAGSTTAAETVDRVVAVINDDVITLSELMENGREYIDRVVQSAPGGDEEQALREAQERVLAKMIDQRLVSQEAEKAGISVSEQELEQSYQKRLAEMGLTRPEFLEKLQRTGLSEDKFLQDLRSQVLRDKLILYEIRSKVIITDEMIEKRYRNEYASELDSEGYHLQQIGVLWGESEEILDSSELIEADKARARKRAEMIREKLRAGAEFADLARQESDLPSADDGGDLGIFQRDELAGYMREAILELQPGEITPVLETPNGFQIFKLLARLQEEEMSTEPPVAVREKIRQELFEEKFNEEFRSWVEDIRGRSYVREML